MMYEVEITERRTKTFEAGVGSAEEALEKIRDLYYGGDMLTFDDEEGHETFYDRSFEVL